MAAVNSLKNLLNDDIRQLNELADLLKTEKEKLAESDIAALEPLTQQKNDLLGQIRERAKRKIHLLVEMGYRPNSGSPSRFIQSSGVEDLIKPWQAAEDAMAACHELNSVNHRVVTHVQKRLARLSDIFRGTSGQQKLYGATGEQTSMNHRTILASA